MNEKIKELALDAGIGFVLWDDSGREMIDNYTPEERLVKFAELIIQECCQALHPMLRDQISRGQGVDLIKKHFGVEE